MKKGKTEFSLWTPSLHTCKLFVFCSRLWVFGLTLFPIFSFNRHKTPLNHFTYARTFISNKRYLSLCKSIWMTYETSRTIFANCLFALWLVFMVCGGQVHKFPSLRERHHHHSVVFLRSSPSLPEIDTEVIAGICRWRHHGMCVGMRATTSRPSPGPGVKRIFRWTVCWAHNRKIMTGWNILHITFFHPRVYPSEKNKEQLLARKVVWSNKIDWGWRLSEICRKRQIKRTYNTTAIFFLLYFIWISIINPTTEHSSSMILVYLLVLFISIFIRY